MNKKPVRTFILFKQVAAADAAGEANIYSNSMMLFGGVPGGHDRGEEWKTENAKTGKIKKTRIEFVAMIDNPKDVIKKIAEAPSGEYLLFCGEVQELKIANTVFMGGKNLSTLDSEWA